MQESELKQILKERIQVIFEGQEVESSNQYPMESIVMFVDELGLEELPSFIRSDGEYIIEFVVEDIKLKDQVSIEVILMNFLDIVSNESLGLAILKDHQLLEAKKKEIRNGHSSKSWTRSINHNCDGANQDHECG